MNQRRFEQRDIRPEYNVTENKLWGYAALFNTPTQITEYGKRFTEVVKPGAFARSLKENRDTICTFNHDVNTLLGRTSSGTLQLREDEKGLYFEVQLSDKIESHREVAELAKRGDLQGASFTFTVPKNGEKRTGETRELHDVNVWELGPVVIPAYKQTFVGMRSEEQDTETNLNEYKMKLMLLEM